MNKCYLRGFATALILIFSFEGCGLDDRNDQSHTVPNSAPTSNVPYNPGSPNPVVQPSPKPTGPILKVQWLINEHYDSKQVLTRSIIEDEEDIQSYRLDFPITLPWHLSADPLEVEIKGLPFKLSEGVKLKPSIKIESSSQPGLLKVTPDFISQEREKGTTGLKFSISGLRTIFEERHDNEERAIVEFTFSGESPSDKFSIKIVFLTPPSKVVFVQKTLKEFEAMDRKLSDDLKYFESPAKKLSLIQVVQLHNLSDQPVSVDLQTNLKGKLSQKSKWSDPQYSSYAKETCYFKQETIETEEIYSTDFVTLPLEDSLPSEWQTLIGNELNPILIQPNEKKLFGLYATPTNLYEKEFKTLLNRRSPKDYSTANPVQTVAVASKCDFSCSSYTLTDSFKNQCSSLAGDEKNSCSSRVTGCSLCVNARKFGMSWQMYCNSCFRDEYTQRDKVIESLCPSGWQKNVVETKQGRRGTELGSIRLGIRDIDTLANVRYGNLLRENDPQDRLVTILLESNIQDQ